MNFKSVEFIWFFLLVIPLYFLVPRKLKWVFLLVASCFFYGAFIPSYLLILFLLIGIDFFTAILIEKSRHKKTWLVVSISSNLLLLGFFKYHNFFISELNSAGGWQLPLHHYILPIGLSFHTFQSMSYTIEVYRKKQKAILHPGVYALYVMFFPQLVAGPIERPQHLLPQFFDPAPFSITNLYRGLQLICLGFFKKIVIADRVSDYVDVVFTYPGMANGTQAILAIAFFTIQIYADFSGYSDIARGTARCMGFELTLNFNLPYHARNIREFWNRWHISLYSWFRDYVYIPLGGSRNGQWKTYRNYLFTFALSGLWHGAGIQFIVWGLIHASYIIIDRLVSPVLKLPGFVSTVLTMIAVSLAWVFFRASDLQNALDVIRACSRLSFETFTHWKLPVDTAVPYGNYSLALICICSLLMFRLDRLAIAAEKNEADLFSPVSVSALIMCTIFFGIYYTRSFIYFQF